MRATYDPPILATEYLESLGFRVTDRGIVNKRKRMQILTVERIEDGSVADFSFCSNLDRTAGVVLPYPVEYYTEGITLEEEE